MLKGLAIVILVASVLPVHGQEQSQHPSGNQSRSQSSPNPPPSPHRARCIVRADGTALACQWAAGEPESKFQRLFSPENTPNIALVLVGIGGILAALWTLRKLERQTKATESAAYTATRELAFSNRAYVGARIDKYMFEIGRPLNVSVIFENKGKTPAHKVRTCQVTRLIRRGEGTTITYPDERWSPGFSNVMPDGHTLRLGNAVGSDNQPRITSDGLLTRELHDCVRTNELSPVTYGQIQYEDIFGVPHWTTFCFSMLVLPPVQGVGDAPAWGPSPVGNDMDKNQEQPSTGDQQKKRWWQTRRKTPNPN